MFLDVLRNGTQRKDLIFGLGLTLGLVVEIISSHIMNALE
jgi:hypothetical protein